MAIARGDRDVAGNGGRNRGFTTWQGIPTMITYHPAYLLRQPREKRKAWQDLQALFPHIQRRGKTTP